MKKTNKLYDYKLHPNPIGNGAFSTVYLGYDNSNNIVAVKTIKVRKLPCNKIDEFMTELDITKNMVHDNIVKCHVTLKNMKHWYIVVEYCNAGTLYDYYIQLRYMTDIVKKEKTIRNIICQLKNALQYLRQQNLVHRDIKPKNILFNEYHNSGCLTLKLADFGLARYYRENEQNDDGTSIQEETICGSLMYMAPELLIAKSFNIRADLWSVGIIMYELLYGTNPFGYPKGIPQLIDMVNKQQIQFENIYSKNCMDLIKSLLVFEPKNRISWELFFNHPWFINSENILLTRSPYNDEMVNLRKKTGSLPIDVFSKTSLDNIDIDEYVMVDVNTTTSPTTSPTATTTTKSKQTNDTYINLISKYILGTK